MGSIIVSSNKADWDLDECIANYLEANPDFDTLYIDDLAHFVSEGFSAYYSRERPSCKLHNNELFVACLGQCKEQQSIIASFKAHLREPSEVGFGEVSVRQFSLSAPPDLLVFGESNYFQATLRIEGVQGFRKLEEFLGLGKIAEVSQTMAFEVATEVIARVGLRTAREPAPSAIGTNLFYQLLNW